MTEIRLMSDERGNPVHGRISHVGGKAYVLLSGGIDSTVCLYQAWKHHPLAEGISIDYGQRHKKEIDYARKSCEYLGLAHRTISMQVPSSSILTNEKALVPNASYEEMKGATSPLYVPFRNGLFLSMLTALAVAERCTIDPQEEWAVYFGAHADWAYPDCSQDWVEAMADAIHIGTGGMVRLVTPLTWSSRPEVMKFGEVYHVNWNYTYSCYTGNEQHCGVCPTCRARKAGFTACGIPDPTDYAT